MIESLKVKNFKSLVDIDFNFSALNLICGRSCAGKSSVIESLLLLRQSYEMQSYYCNRLSLDGCYKDIGVAQDAFYIGNGQTSLEFHLKFKEKKESYDFKFRYKNNSSLLDSFGRNWEGLEGLVFFNTQFKFLNNKRGLQKRHYNLYDSDNQSFTQYSDYVVPFISFKKRNKIRINGLIHKNAVDDSLFNNIECWIYELSGGLTIKVHSQIKFDAAYLDFELKINGEFFDLKSKNVGFGLHYILPLLTLLLTSEKGDFVIIENPELHLDSTAQSILGRLCAICAQAGVQLIIDSNSDHFFNAIRVAVKKNVVCHDKVSFLFLERDFKTSCSKVTHPKINSEGLIESWPDGFFDEADNLLEQLL